METSGTGTGGAGGVVNPDSVNVTAASAARDFDVLVYGIGSYPGWHCERCIDPALL